MQNTTIGGAPSSGVSPLASSLPQTSPQGGTVSPIQQTPQIATQPTATPAVPLDPTIVNVAKAIRTQETGAQGNFTALGGSGEYGAYQFTQPTWDSVAPLAGVTSKYNQSTPQEQNAVAYAYISQLKNQGYNVGQIASIWNSGKPDPTGSVGTNASGVAYNTPQYVQNVYNNYQALKTQTPDATQQPAGTGAAQSTDPGVISDIAGGNILGAAKDVGNFAFPIVSDLANDFNGSSTKTTLQQLGDAGMSAAWFLPFGDLAEGATDVARAGLGLAEDSKAASTIGNIATGLGTGYATNVASNLSQGQTGTAALKPGLQTVIGGALPVAAEGLGSVYNKFAGQQSMIDQIQNAYEDAAGATKSGIKGMSKTSSRGLNPNPEFLANAGILPETEEINGRRVFTTGENSVSQQTLQGRINDLTSLRDTAISKAGTNTPLGLEDMRTTALDEADTQFAGTALDAAKNHINAEFDAYKNQFGDGKGNISLTDANKIKMDLQGKTKYDATRPSLITQSNSLMAKVAQTVVEDKAESAGLPGIKALNKVIAQHINAKDFLTKLNGQTIKGGKIGKYLSEGIGATIGNSLGGAVGNVLGSTGIGAGVGTLAGAGAGALFSKFLQKFSSGGTISAAAIGRMASQDPEVVQNFLDYLGQGSFKEGEKIAPVLQPEESSTEDIFQNILSKAPGQAILNALKEGYSLDEIKNHLSD